MKVVVSQPMFLPWVGIFAQAGLAEVFVHYDDVQLPRGRSFVSRVQVATREGSSWLTAPIDRARSGTMISQSVLVGDRSWRDKHLETLRHCYGKSPRFAQMFDLAREIYSFEGDNLAAFNIAALERIAGRIGLKPRFLRSSELGIGGRGTERLIDICRHLGARTYVTGHGAAGYLDHAAFEAEGVAVEYMDYRPVPWPQLHGDFTPFVTILDLLAAVPYEAAASHLNPATVDWRTFLARRGEADASDGG